MADIKNKIKEKISKYSNDEYLNGYIKNEFLTDDGDADIILNVSDKSELFDLRTKGRQIDLSSSVYEYIEDKTSMLDNNIKIILHINGIKLSSNDQGIIRHIIKEHYAIELYKIQKEYVKCRKKIIILLLFGLIMLISYLLFNSFNNLEILTEVFSFFLSFSLWEAFDAIIYSLHDIRAEREAITQNLLIKVLFDDFEV